MDYLDDYRVNVSSMKFHYLKSSFDFFDKLKSSTKGYASLDYEMSGYRTSKLVKMDILLNAEKVDALSFIVHRDFSYERGKAIVEKLKNSSRVNNLKYRLQAAIGQKSWLAPISRLCAKMF